MKRKVLFSFLFLKNKFVIHKINLFLEKYELKTKNEKMKKMKNKK